MNSYSFPEGYILPTPHGLKSTWKVMRNGEVVHISGPFVDVTVNGIPLRQAGQIRQAGQTLFSFCHEVKRSQG